MSAPTLMEEAWEALEDRIYDHQERLIRERYGEEAARKANYGWGVDETDDSISIATKIYQVGLDGGRDVLTTTGSINDNMLEDDWEVPYVRPT